jgi:hypothetical protein
LGRQNGGGQECHRKQTAIDSEVSHVYRLFSSSHQRPSGQVKTQTIYKICVDMAMVAPFRSGDKVRVVIRQIRVDTCPIYSGIKDIWQWP